MTAPTLSWRYIPATDGPPSHLLTGPIPFLRDGRHVLAMEDGHTVGGVTVGRAEPLLPAEYAEWLWERLSTPVDPYPSLHAIACPSNHSNDPSECECDNDQARVLRVPCPACAEAGHRPALACCYTVTSIRPATESETPTCAACDGDGGVHVPGWSPCKTCGGTGRAPGLYLVGELASE
jgi:hypothetical protein